jgi:NAD(P)H-hydrate repair Nnr-like enzyme with NAD(P)H-hydrate dehydratase domain
MLAHPRDDLSILVDAAAITVASGLEDPISSHAGRVILTPHFGEMATLMQMEKEDVAASQAEVAVKAAQRFGALIVLKSGRTVIAAPDGKTLEHRSESPGLGTGGSGGLDEQVTDDALRMTELRNFVSHLVLPTRSARGRG